jgi:hypothetical protein
LTSAAVGIPRFCQFLYLPLANGWVVHAYGAADMVAVEEGVEGNSRLTASNAAAIFVLLAIEGVTVLSVRSLLHVHVFVGMVLVPLAVLKIATTTYRAARYYLGTPSYRRKGPPPIVLRVLGPFVIVLTAAVLGTGVVLVLRGPGDESPWLFLHKASFVLWFGAMTVHVLGHLVETARVAPRDWTPRAPKVPGVVVRRLALVGALVLGVVLGFAFQHSASDWLAHASRFD